MKKAENASTRIETNQYLENARKRCLNIIKNPKSNSFGYHTMLKIDLFDFEESIKYESTEKVEKSIKQFEKTLNKSKQAHPNEPFILEIEARFNELLNEKPSAVKVLEDAYKLNPASPFIAIRYAKLLHTSCLIDKAIETLTNTLKLNPNDKNVNYLLAQIIGEKEPLNYELSAHYYRRSFTLGDTRFEAQFWYARALYLDNRRDEALKFFSSLSRQKLSPKVKNKPKGFIINKDGEYTVFKGKVENIENNFGFVSVEKYGDNLFMYRYPSIKDWSDFKFNTRLKFNIAFNYKGPVILNPVIV